MKLNKKTLTLLGSLISLIIITILGAGTFPTQNNELRVLEVVDGDTFKTVVNGQKETIRILGINTPEVASGVTKEQCYGPEASAKSKNVLSGKVIRLEADETQTNRDKYDRLLRYVYLEDGTDYGKLLVSEGFAKEYTFKKAYAHQQEYKMAQFEAQQKSLGLWKCP